MTIEKMPPEPNPNSYIWGIQIADVQRLAIDWLGRYCTEEEMDIISRRAFIGFPEWKGVQAAFQEAKNRIQEAIAELQREKKLK